jgi:hypothetical protein
MTTIQILVLVDQSVSTEVPVPIAPGKRFVFSDDLVLERYDDSTPGFGLPQNPDQRLAGTQSGFTTIVRIAAATGDRFFPPNSRVLEYLGTYKFNALDDTPLQKGQITAQGIFVVDSNGNRLDLPNRFAITGGTGPYNTAHGTITERVPTKDHRLLDIEL